MPNIHLQNCTKNFINEYISAAEGKTGYKQITDRLKNYLKQQRPDM